MLDANLISQLKTYLERLTEPIELVSSLDDGPKSRNVAELLDEIASTSDKVSVRRADDDPRRPSFAITRPGADISIRFAGLPLGHEFSSLVLALLQIGGVPVKEEQAVIDAVTSLEGEYHFVTYMSLSCQNCPTVVQALNAMAVLNPNITHTAVEGGTFQDEVEQRRVLAVPTVFLNDDEWGSGRMSMGEIVARLDTNARSRNAEQLTERDPYDVLVVGGGPAGVSAAIYAARKGIRTGLVAERMGGQVMDTNAIENFISVPYTEGPQLAAMLEEHMGRYEVDAIKMANAHKLVPGHDGELHTVEFDGGGTLRSKTLVIATGARWRRLGVPGEEQYRNKGVTFCPHCDGPLFKGKRIAVIGGGNSGIEAALDLAGVVGHVTVVEFLDVLKADEVLLDKVREAANIDVVVSARTTEVSGDGTKVTGLEYEDRTTGEMKHLDVEGVFVQIGLLPNTEWLKDTLETQGAGEVVIDAHGATSIPGVFAAGDCTTEPFKQIVIAMGGGATAALSAFNYLLTGTLVHA